MGDSNLTAAGVLSDAIRGLFSWLDRPAFWLLGLVYQLFFNVASATLFSGATIMNFFSRVQLILGVFTMFQLAMSILKGIVNPDNFFGKDKGVKSIISRIVIALVMLTLITPISIPAAKNEYEKQINNNGILFGTLYSLQHRLLSNNTLGRLILGTTDTSASYISGDSDDELKTSSRVFASTVLKSFYRINLIDYDSRKHESGKDDAVFNENRVCQDIDDDVLAAYTRLDADTGEIIDMVNATCDSDGGIIKSVIKFFKKLTGNEYYVFAYTPLLGAVVAFIFSFILLSFTVDVAVRAVKLSVLRLIAPIPIISYMNPNGSKDNAFNSWVKMLTTTYLDLFVRLAVVYFVIFLIQDMIANGLSINSLNGEVGGLSFIMICIGLFIFAKQAPKFFKDVLGLKSEPFKLFGGFGEMMGAATIGAGVLAGGISGGVAHAKNGGNFGGALLNGIRGAASGGINAGKSYLSSGDKTDYKKLMQGVRANSAKNYKYAEDDSTLGGRALASLQSNLGLKNEYQTLSDRATAYKNAEGAWKRLDSALGSDDKKLSISHGLSHNGETLFDASKQYTVKDARDIVSRMKSSGMYSQKDISDAEEIQKEIEKSRFDEIHAKGRRESFDSLSTIEQQVYTSMQAIESTAIKYKEEKDGVFSAFSQFDSPDAVTGVAMGMYKGAGYGAGRQATSIENSPAYAAAKANAERSSEKK